MSENASPPIIIIKKKGGHAGHHGGAWKVAYADFVTAMMSLFIVLWLLNSTPPVKEAIAGYFKDPSGKGTKAGSAMAGTGESISLKADDMERLKDRLEEAMKKMPDFQKMKDQVEMTVTGEGLRIELLETEKGMFFDSGDSEPSKTGQELLAKLSSELGKLQNKILLEGHTDARPFTSKRNYSNWELSADRANAARRLMEDTGLRPDQITQVRGYAAQKLRNVADPDAPSNRRISLIVQYSGPVPGTLEQVKGEKSKTEGAQKAGGEQGKH